MQKYENNRFLSGFFDAYFEVAILYTLNLNICEATAITLSISESISMPSLLVYLA